MNKTVKTESGSLSLGSAGDGCWKVYRGTEHIGTVLRMPAGCKVKWSLTLPAPWRQRDNHLDRAWDAATLDIAARHALALVEAEERDA